MICAWEAAGRSEGTAGENRPPVAQPQTTRGGGARLQEASALSQDRLPKHARARGGAFSYLKTLSDRQIGICGLDSEPHGCLSLQ